MKSAINIWTYAAAFALLGTACDNSEYDLQTLVPDNYHAVINVQDDVDEAARIFDTGRSENINFTILRGGSDSSIAIEAQAVTMTQEALSQLGSDYVLLPWNVIRSTVRFRFPPVKAPTKSRFRSRPNS